jgi:hypothetical protein
VPTSDVTKNQRRDDETERALDRFVALVRETPDTRIGWEITEDHDSPEQLLALLTVAIRRLAGPATEPTPETEAQIEAALAVPIVLVDEPIAPPTNPNWPVDLRTAREATPREIRWANKQCTTCGYFPPCQCPGNPFGTGTGIGGAQ